MFLLAFGGVTAKYMGWLGVGEEGKTVETGISDYTHIQVLSGIEEGEEVVTGSYRILSNELADGDKVNINNRKFSSR